MASATTYKAWWRSPSDAASSLRGQHAERGGERLYLARDAANARRVGLLAPALVDVAFQGADHAGRDLQREVFLVAQVREHDGFRASAALRILNDVVGQACVDDFLADPHLAVAPDVQGSLPPEPGYHTRSSESIHLDWGISRRL